MILLFNLNKYIGGGETLLIRLAQYLHVNRYEYQILTASDGCWIQEVATKHRLNSCIWPSSVDSVIYQSSHQREETLNAIKNIFGDVKEIRVFTFCMRDMYNAMYIFTRMPDIKVWMSHGIYHPEDVFYLASFNFQSRKIIANNRSIARKLYDSNSILFVNHNGFATSLNLSKEYNSGVKKPSILIPLPISIHGEIPRRKFDNNRNFKIICISRFVDFKVAAVLAIMRYAGNRQGVELLVIGHGPWKFVLDAWIRFRRIRNIRIITGVSPDQLDLYIDTCDIGYAQGTSILEIAKRGLPVLIAPYSRIKDLCNKQFPSLGIFGDIKDSSAFGDVTDLRGLKTYAISECVDAIRKNYEHYQLQSIEFVRTFEADLVCKKIVQFILAAEFSNQQIPFQLPRAPLIKRLVKKIFRSRN